MKKIFTRGTLKNKSAFTLAETLITLVIVGVIAAITVPTLINNKIKQETVAKLTKIYATLSNATNLIVFNSSEQIHSWSFNDQDNDETERLFLLYKPYLSIMKSCKNTTGCWSKTPTKNLNGQEAHWGTNMGVGSNVYSAILNDGTTISFDINCNKGSFGLSNNSTTCILIAVDINGNKRPNKAGHDVFYFMLSHTGLVPAGKDNGYQKCTTNNKTNEAGFDCAAKVLKEGNITYY